MKNSRTNILSFFQDFSPRIIKPLIINGLLAFVITLIASVFYIPLQPEIPLHYSLAQKSDQLLQKEWIAIFPVFSFTTTILYTLILSFKKESDELIHALFGWAGVSSNIIALLILLRLLYAVF